MTPPPTVFRYRAKGAYVRVLPTGRKEIEKLAQQFIDEIRAKGTGAETSKRLFRALLKPIPEAATATRFIIAPDGILNLLPFEALRDDQGEYLLKSRVISYVPSGTILILFAAARKNETAPKPASRQSVMSPTRTKAARAGEFRLQPLSADGFERGIADFSGMRPSRSSADAGRGRGNR